MDFLEATVDDDQDKGAHQDDEEDFKEEDQGHEKQEEANTKTTQ